MGNKELNEADLDVEFDSPLQPRKKQFKWWEFVLICILAIFIGLRLNSCEDNSKVSKATNLATRETNTPQESDLNYSIIQERLEWLEHPFYDNYTKAIIVVKNTGDTNLYLGKAHFDIEDSKGHLIASKSVSSYPSVIAPGEIGIYYGTFVVDNVGQKEKYRSVTSLDLEKSKVAPKRLKVSDLSILENDASEAKITGRITNTLQSELTDFKAVAIFYDKNGKVLGLDYNYPRDMTRGETIGFEMYCDLDGFVFSDIASYEVIAYPNQYQF